MIKTIEKVLPRLTSFADQHQPDVPRADCKRAEKPGGKTHRISKFGKKSFPEILLRSTFAKDAFPDIWHCGDCRYGGVWMGTHHAGENTNISEYFKGEMIF